ncbi:MAG: leucyl aminopeptidase [bacterium]|nr:leucyl aminopeptidase [bacterium]
MKHIYQSSPPKATHARVVALFKEEKASRHSFIVGLHADDRAYVDRISKNFSADFLESEKFVLPRTGSPMIVFIGLGEKKQWSLRRLIKASRKVISVAKSAKCEKLAIQCEDWIVSQAAPLHSIEAFVTNTEMAQYEFHRYLETPKTGWPVVSEIVYVSGKTSLAAKYKQAIDTGKIIGDATSFARDLSNTPAGDMTPSHLAQEARVALKEANVSISVLSEKEMMKLGMGGILAVSNGSKEEAKLLVMEYKGGRSGQKPIMFIGKGITFDSGGMNLKPSSAMDEMHMDMMGGASVIAVMQAIGKLKVTMNVIGIVPAVENMLSGASYRPGDILRTMSGKTIEVTNTDAEGRVVLADALTYAEKYKPSLVVDVATLTGACVVALGHQASAILSPDEKLEGRLRVIGEESGDYVWPLPMWEEYEADVKGTIGDVINASKKREAGTIDGAMFLYQFAKKFPLWAHMDIASTMTTYPDQLLAKGASGTSVRFLIALARNWK